MKLSRLYKRPALTGLVVWFGFAWSWVFFTDMLDLAGSKQQGFILAVFVYVLNVTITSSILWQAITLLTKVHKRYGKKGLVAMGLPIFALADFLACWLTTIIWLGPQGSADNVLPMGSLALPMVNTPLKFAARFLGFYGIAAVLWFFIYLVARKDTRKLAWIPVALVSVLSIVGWALYRVPNGRQIPVKLVSERLTGRVATIDGQGSELVVFPEYGLEKIDNKNLKERIKRTGAGEAKTYFLGSEQIYRPKVIGHINNMMFGNSTDGITDKEYKYRLIPGGEDLPYVVRLLLRATGQKGTLDYFSYAKSVIKGQYQLQPFVVNGDVRVAAAVCSSIIAPQDYRDFARSGATLFTNSASLSIFKNSPLFAWQQKSLARFMAVANARPFLQSANAASAYALDMNGKQVAEKKGYGTVDVLAQTNSRNTPYILVGEWLVWLGLVVVAGVGFLQLRQHPKLQKGYRTKMKPKSVTRKK